MITRGPHPAHWKFINLGGYLGSGRVWVDPSRVTELAAALDDLDDWPFFMAKDDAVARILAL